MNNRGQILSALFDCCPSEWFDRRIGGRIPNDRIRSTIPRPRDALASLRRRFSEQDLIAAGVAEPDAFGELQIVAKLCQAGGAVMALRRSPTEPPYDLMTERGSLAGVRHSVISALDDSRRVALVEETGMMIAARRIHDIAVLDMIDLPVTHGFGLSSLSLSGCREIDAIYGEGLTRFVALDSEQDQEVMDTVDTDWDSCATDESAAFRPTLVLIDRLRHRTGDEPSIWLRITAHWFAKVKKHTGLQFAGLWIWQPDDGYQERIQFAYRLQDRAQIREVILQSLTSLVDVDHFVQSADVEADAGPKYLTARRTLIEQLGVGTRELAVQGGQLADSISGYDSAVRLELAEPLIDWAQGRTNPVICAAGAQLAEVVTLLHRITPRLHAMQVNGLHDSSGQDGAVLAPGLFTDYMQLLDRFNRLSSAIIKWMTA